MPEPIFSTQNLSKSVSGRQLFAQVSIGLLQAERLGIIGDNGSGKSTLLRIIAQQIVADEGTVAYKKGLKVSYLPQIPQFENATISAVLSTALQDLQDAIAAYEKPHTAEESATLLERIERLGGWDYQHRIEKAATMLDLGDLQTPIDQLSGGKQKRVLLARFLLEDADLILLDEPTNHLDMNTIDWLEKWLVQCGKASIFVTHDRTFLDNVAQRMLEIRQGSARAYQGNYTDYLTQRAVEEDLESRTNHRLQRVLVQELDWAKRSPKARTTKSQARLDRIEQAQTFLEQRTATTPLMQQMPQSQSLRLGRRILTIEDLHYRYPLSVTDLIQLPTWELKPQERWGLVGLNGAGKTTFLKLVAQMLKPSSGKIQFGKNTETYYFEQHRDNLPPEKSVRQALLPDGGDHVFLGEEAIHISSWLSRFAFDSGRLDQRIAQLSGGEKNRLALAMLMLAPANVLLLDEPTNDLDLLTLNVLENALLQFRGCILVASHDRYFLDRVATGILGFGSPANAPASPLVYVSHGNYSDYLEHRQQTDVPGHQSVKKEKPVSKKESKKPQSLSYKENRELEQSLIQIEKIDLRVKEIEVLLNQPEMWEKENQSRSHELTEEMKKLQNRSEELFETWSRLQERLDSFK